MDTATPPRTGRIAYFEHEPWREPPAIVEKWRHHEASILANLAANLRLSPAPAPVPGTRWVVWRLLSGNNREIARGVGAFATLDSARVAAVRAIRSGEAAQAVLAFDRKSAHAWCLQLDAMPLVIAPSWHRSRRTNRLNLETARVTLGQADPNGAVTSLDGHSRAVMRA